MVLGHSVTDELRTQDIQISQDVTFDTMLLAGNTLQGLTNSGFYKPSPIQLHAIPLGKCGFDLILEAKSGTGKTAVFTIIALEKLELSKDLQTLILAPTREIAFQICDAIKQIGSCYKGLNVEVVIGGLPVQDDIAKFKKRVHIVVGSPGRLRHLIHDKYINISSVRFLVLDEADKLLDKSFLADINYIFSVLPKQKQVILSSATYPESLTTVIKKYVQNAQHICPDTTNILLGIRQLVTTVESHTHIIRQTQYRFEELLKILTKRRFKQCLIFCNFQVRVKELSKMLIKEKWPAEQLHGQQEQSDRLDALKTLQEYKCRILISTDLAARGIDASNVDLVINFEPPHEWQTYLHRIGRAGRFGSYGTAITILSEGNEKTKFNNMITAMNSSVELCNLWDEEKYDLDHSDSSSYVSVCAPKSPNTSLPTTQILDDNKIFDERNNENMGTNAEIPNFDDLFNSFKKSKFEKSEEYKIESFSDLLTSFGTHQNEDTLDSKPNNVSFHITDDFNNLSVHDDTTEMKTNISVSTFATNESANLNNNLYDDGISDSPKFIPNDDSGKPYKLKEINKDFSTNKCNGINNHEVDQTTKALLDAGLPTSFGHQAPTLKPKAKYKRRQKRNTKNEQHQARINITKDMNTTSSDTSSDELEEDGNNIQLHQLNQFTKNKHVFQKDTNQYINYDKKHRMQRNNDEKSPTRQEKYEQWYNKLKAHVDQFQMAIYIEELSKANHY